MTDRYIDTGGSGTSPYDTWAKAANTNTLAQTVIDAAVAGDTIHAQGTLTLTATLDIDQNDGNVTSGFIKFIGYNGSEVNDGTRFIIDGNDAVVNVINDVSRDYWWFENIECKNGTGDGFTGGSAYYCVFNNCCANNNGVYGFDSYQYYSSMWIRCVAYSNNNSGFGNGRANHRYLFCRSRDNGGDGFNLQYASYSILLGCIADNNTLTGFGEIYAMPILINCVSDNNTVNGMKSRGIANIGIASVIGCRVTNHDGAGDIGIDMQTNIFAYGWNYYQNNSDVNVQNATLAEEILDNGAGTDDEDQGDTESGYVDEDDPEDYNLTDVATSRRTGIQIPVS